LPNVVHSNPGSVSFSTTSGLSGFVGIQRCDGYFRNLAKERAHKRSLTEMITGEDRSFISYDPTGPDYGRRSIIPLPWAESHCAGAIRWSLPRSYTNWHTLMERRASWKRKMLSFIAV
jgi:hypothetical protein